MTATMLAAALDYANRRWPVIALHAPNATSCTCNKPDCTSVGKHPRTINGLKDATCDPGTIREWWQRWPQANIGLRTGIAFDVLDIDALEGGQRLAQLADHAGLDTETCWADGPMSITAHGAHLLYQPTGRGNKAGIVPKVDWRGKDGYIVAPPSIHATGAVYRWHENCPPDAPLGVAPAFLIGLLDSSGRAPRKPDVFRGGSPSTRALMLPLGLTDHGWTADALLARLAIAEQGERNDVLHWCAWRVGSDRRAREVTETAAIAALEALANVAERIGLGATETDKTVRSGYSAGLNGQGVA